MPAFKSAYLIHGDDHGRVAERRARLRALAESESGPNGVEVFDAAACTPDAVCGALTAMTFAIGRRFVIADGVERWKEADAERVAGALAGVEPDTLTVAFFAREEGKAKAPDRLHSAVKAVGGVVATETAVKLWELPKWVAARAGEMDLELDSQAAKRLVAQVGERQQRLLRELEKLALEHGLGAHIGVEEIEASCASSAERRVWALGDALVAGDAPGASGILLELRAQGERLPSLLYAIVRRLREALSAAEALAAGQPVAQVKRGLRMSPKAADRLIADVSRRDVAALRAALVALADLELESRGGGGAELSEDTAAVRAVLAATA
ncbi:MAG: DNA polymerase III subunit delta [Actinomycetota bacterium]|nr:DNA polymerase III subunit delta [Actinomycetota bacterium]